MKAIIVTGSVGTGKTTLAKRLAEKLNMNYLDVNKLIKKYNISEGYDKKRKTKIIDIKKLNKTLIKEIANYKKTIKKIINKQNSNISIKSNKIKTNNNKTLNIKKINKNKIIDGIIIDSHLSHYLPKRYVDLCIVAKCELKVLERRLKKRRYSKDKIRENLDAEIFDVCLNEAKENKHKILVINTTKPINIETITNKINQ